MTTLERIHPAVVKARENFHADTLAEVVAAVQRDKVVVVGMAWNPVVKSARRLLHEQEIPYTYLEYGNYLVGWKRRLAIKLWAGWPTFPMVFIRGTLIGGHADLAALQASGELKTLLA